MVLALTMVVSASAEEASGPKPMPPMPDKAPPAIDTDGDGKVSEEERQAGREKMKEIFEARRKEMIAKFDKDGDGKLSEEERKAAQETRKAEFLAKFDKDGDGKLSEEERKAVGDMFGKRPGGPGGPGGSKFPGKRPGKEAAEVE